MLRPSQGFPVKDKTDRLVMKLVACSPSRRNRKGFRYRFLLLSREMVLQMNCGILSTPVWTIEVSVLIRIESRKPLLEL